MALGLKQLAENITNSIQGFRSLFTDTEKSSPTYPKDDAINKIISQISQGNWTKTLPYSFNVIDVTQQNLQASQFGRFQLPINPSELNQDENFAINIKPTQGGTVVQHSGNRYKDLVIAGTTGVHPGRKDTGALSSTGQAILSPNTLPFQSGYYIFLELRNWFRAYYELKKNDPTTKNLRLIFENFKDGEFLIVELLKFSMKRSADRPFLYDYSLQFRVLGNQEFKKQPDNLDTLSQIDNTFNQALEKLNAARGVFLRGQSILRQIESNLDQSLNEPLRRVALSLKAVVGAGNVAADMGPALISKFNSTATATAVLLGLKSQQDNQANSGTLDPRIAQIVLPPSTAGIENLAASEGLNFLLNQQNDSLLAVSVDDFPAAAREELAKNQADAASEPRSTFVTIKEQLIRIRDNAADRFGVGSPDYDEQFDRVVTFGADPGKVITDEEVEVLYGFNQAIQSLNLMLATPRFYKSGYSDLIADVEAKFDDNLGLVAQPAVKQIIMPANTDLETLALTYLGNSSRWPEIVELNQLKPPYVVQDKTASDESVVHPGDPLLIPQPVVSGFSNVETNQVLPINENLSEVERNLGIDLRLTREYDIEINNTNDFELIAGAENAGQALVLKLQYEKGELFKHPELGVGIVLGTKVATVTEFHAAIIDAITKDPRFEKVQNIQLVRLNGKLAVTLDVKIKNVDTPVPLTLRL